MLTVVLLRLSHRCCSWIVDAIDIAVGLVDMVDADADANADDIVITANDDMPNVLSSLCQPCEGRRM